MSVVEATDHPGPGDGREFSAGGPLAAGPGRLADFIGLLRPSHAAKSLLLVPLAFVTAPSWTLGALVRDGWATLVFLTASACVYVVNDIADRHSDSSHPVKHGRPIASGRVPVALAYAYSAALAGGLAAMIVAGPAVPYWPVLAYMAVNVAYSRFLKHVPLIDVSVVAMGYVLRAVQGYVAVGDPLPAWLLVAVFSLALTFVLGKRRHELIEAGAACRPALRGYSVELVDHLLQFTGVLAAVAGLISLRTEAPFGPSGRAALLLSTPFAFLLLARYLKLVFVDRSGGDPVRVLLRDRVMVATSVLWMAVLAAVLAVSRYPELAHAVLR